MSGAPVVIVRVSSYECVGRRERERERKRERECVCVRNDGIKSVEPTDN